MNRGIFITFEGPEGAGKSTQINLLADFFRQKGRQCTVTREPGGTPLAERLREIIKHFQSADEILTPETELLLMEAARAQHVANVIVPALERGEVVLCDRFTDSTVAYQGHGRKFNLEWIDALNRFAMQKLNIDRTLLFDLPVESGFARTCKRTETQGKFDRFEEQKIQFHQTVRQGFLALAEANPARVRVIDASQSIDQVQALIREAVNDLL